MERATIERIRPASAIPHVTGLASAIPAARPPEQQPEGRASKVAIEDAIRTLRTDIAAMAAIKVIDAKEVGRRRYAGKSQELIDAAVDYELATLAMFNVRDDDAFPPIDYTTKLVASMAIKELQIRLFDRMGRAKEVK